MDAGGHDGKLVLLNPTEGGTAGFMPAVPPFDFPGPAALQFLGEAGMAMLRVVKKSLIPGFGLGDSPTIDKFALLRLGSTNS